MKNIAIKVVFENIQIYFTWLSTKKNSWYGGHLRVYISIVIVFIILQLLVASTVSRVRCWHFAFITHLGIFLVCLCADTHHCLAFISRNPPILCLLLLWRDIGDRLSPNLGITLTLIHSSTNFAWPYLLHLCLSFSSPISPVHFLRCKRWKMKSWLYVSIIISNYPPWYSCDSLLSQPCPTRDSSLPDILDSSTPSSSPIPVNPSLLSNRNCWAW